MFPIRVKVVPLLIVVAAFDMLALFIVVLSTIISVDPALVPSNALAYIVAELAFEPSERIAEAPFDPQFNPPANFRKCNQIRRLRILSAS